MPVKFKSLIIGIFIPLFCITLIFLTIHFEEQNKVIESLQLTIQSLENKLEITEKELSSAQASLDNLRAKNNIDSISSMDKYKYLYRNGFLAGLVHAMNPDTKLKGSIGQMSSFDRDYETIRYVDEYLKDYDISPDLLEFSRLNPLS